MAPVNPRGMGEVAGAMNPIGFEEFLQGHVLLSLSYPSYSMLTKKYSGHPYKWK
jgi:hypothetical protein